MRSIPFLSSWRRKIQAANGHPPQMMLLSDEDISESDEYTRTTEDASAASHTVAELPLLHRHLGGSSDIWSLSSYHDDETRAPAVHAQLVLEADPTPPADGDGGEGVREDAISSEGGGDATISDERSLVSALTLDPALRVSPRYSVVFTSSSVSDSTEHTVANNSIASKTDQAAAHHLGMEASTIGDESLYMDYYEQANADRRRMEAVAFPLRACHRVVQKHIISSPIASTDESSIEDEIIRCVAASYFSSTDGEEDDARTSSSGSTMVDLRSTIGQEMQAEIAAEKVKEMLKKQSQKANKSERKRQEVHRLHSTTSPAAANSISVAPFATVGHLETRDATPTRGNRSRSPPSETDQYFSKAGPVLKRSSSAAQLAQHKHWTTRSSTPPRGIRSFSPDTVQGRFQNVSTPPRCNRSFTTDSGQGRLQEVDCNLTHASFDTKRSSSAAQLAKDMHWTTRNATPPRGNERGRKQGAHGGIQLNCHNSNIRPAADVATAKTVSSRDATPTRGNRSTPSAVDRYLSNANRDSKFASSRAATPTRGSLNPQNAKDGPTRSSPTKEMREQPNEQTNRYSFISVLKKSSTVMQVPAKGNQRNRALSSEHPPGTPKKRKGRGRSFTYLPDDSSFASDSDIITLATNGTIEQQKLFNTAPTI